MDLFRRDADCPVSRCWAVPDSSIASYFYDLFLVCHKAEFFVKCPAVGRPVPAFRRYFNEKNMLIRIMNFLAFIFFSIFFLPLVGFVYFVVPVWEKWSENAFDF